MPSNLLSSIFLKIRRRLGTDKDFKEILKSGSTAFAINILGLVVGYIFVTIVSKIYKNSAAEIYGQYIIVTLVIRVASIVARIGSDTALMQLTAGYSSKDLWGTINQTYRQLFKLLAFSGLIVTFLVAVLCKPIASLFHLPVNMVLLSDVFILPMSIGLFYSQGLRGLKKTGISTFLRTTALPVLNFFLLILFILFFRHNNNMVTYTYFVSICIVAIIGFFYWRKAVPADGEDKTYYDNQDNKTLLQLFKTSYPFLLAESMIFIVVWIDQLMLGILGTKEDVGIFNVCTKYVMVAYMSLAAVNTISAPQISEYFFNKDYSGLAQNVGKTNRIIFWTTIPIIIVYCLFPKFLLGIFGKSFQAGWLALIVLSIGAFTTGITGTAGTVLQMTNNQKTVQNVLFATLIIEVILNYILIPIYGVTGAAIASVICSSLHGFAMAFFVRRYFNFTCLYFFGFRWQSGKPGADSAYVP
jgi:O-antigen/teichoic acid export membrane protein